MNPLQTCDVDELYLQQGILGPDDLATVLDWIKTTRDWKPLTQCKGSREVIHYGVRYNYNTGGVGAAADEMPLVIKMLRDILVSRAKRIEDVKLSDLNFVQCIVNKYKPGQSIGAHIDSHDFGPIIGCFVFNIGEGQDSNMTFTLNGEDTMVPTPHNSLYIMTGLSRWNYRHALCGKKSYAERVSVTFRSIAVKSRGASHLATELRDTTTHRVIGIRE